LVDLFGKNATYLFQIQTRSETYHAQKLTTLRNLPRSETYQHGSAAKLSYGHCQLSLHKLWYIWHTEVHTTSVFR